MSIGSYSDLLVQVTRLLDGEDVSVSDLPVGTLRHAIELAEAKIYRDVRTRFNELSFTGVEVTDNAAPIPADFKSLSLLHFGGTPLLPAAEDWVREYLDHQVGGRARHFAVAGGSFIFAPAVSDGVLLEGRYFARLPALDAVTFAANTLIAAAPELFLYATLVEAAPFFSQPDRVPMWLAKYGEIAERLNLERRNAAYSAGRIRIGPSTRLLG